MAENASTQPDLRADTPWLSIVIPAFNEEACIERSLEQVLAFAAEQRRACEVIVVDDGSTDSTAAIVEWVRGRHHASTVRLELIRHGHNRGKGAAVRTGMLHARGEIVLFTDTDLSSPISEIPRLLEPIVAGECDVVIGSRALDRSLIEVRQTRFRETAGKLFNAMVRKTTGLDIRDTQCGFKTFRREAALPLFRMQRIGEFAFDVEILYLASKAGLTIREIPVRWGHVAHTKVRMFRDSVLMFRDVLAIRLNDARGRYGSNGQSERE